MIGAMAAWGCNLRGHRRLCLTVESHAPASYRCWGLTIFDAVGEFVRRISKPLQKHCFDLGNESGTRAFSNSPTASLVARPLSLGCGYNSSASGASGVDNNNDRLRGYGLMEAKEAAARRAVDYVRDGMTVGIGTGSTSAFAIQAIGERVRREGLKLRAVPTSTRSAEMAAALGIPLIDLSAPGIGELDLTID